MLNDEDDGAPEPMDEEEEEEDDNLGFEHMEGVDEPPKDKQEANEQSTDELVMNTILSMETLCEADIPYFSVFPNKKYFGASVVNGALTTCAFVKMLMYFRSCFMLREG